MFVVPVARYFLTHRLGLALEQRARGFEVHVATPPAVETVAIRDSGFSWHPFNMTLFLRRPWGELLTFLDLLRLYRSTRPQLVHHVTFKPILYGTFAARLAGVPAVVNSMPGLGDAHTSDSPRDRLWVWASNLALKWFARHPRMRWILQNRDDLATLEQAGVMRESEVVLIPGAGVDTEAFQPAKRERPEAPPVVAYVGRVVYAKGLREFVGAARRLRAGGVRARFVIAGGLDAGSLTAIDETTLAEWTRDGVVEYAGHLDDVRPLLATVDIVCLPSYREGMPKSLLEAAACGLPVVATDVPGCRDVVVEGDTGYLVPPRDVEKLAEALAKLIRNPDLRARMGARGRARVIERFTARSSIERTLRVHEELLGAQPATTSLS